MGFSQYIRTRLWEMLFCMTAVSALGFSLCGVYYATLSFQQQPLLIIAGCCVATAVLFAIAYNRTTALIGGVVLGCIILAALIILAMLSPGLTPVDDVEGNHVFTLAVIIGSALAVFLATRTRMGTIALLVLGTFVIALIEYLYWYGQVVPLLVFLAAVLAMLIFRTYTYSLRDSMTDRLGFSAVSLVAVALAIVSLLASVGIFYVAVAPLNPPNVVVKIFTEHRRLDEVRIVGTGSVTSQTGGDDGNLANGDEMLGDKSALQTLMDVFQEGVNNLLGMAEDQTGDEGTTSSLLKISLLVLFILFAIALLIAALLALKRYLRKRRFEKLMEGSDAQVVCNLYTYLLKQFGRLRLVRPAGMTPLEFAASSKSSFLSFEQKTSGIPEFDSLTQSYVRASYGGGQVDESDVKSFQDYFDNFYKNTRDYVGLPKYLRLWLFL